MKQMERQKRRIRMEAVSTLTEMGFNRRDAAHALHHADGDVAKAYTVSTLPDQTRPSPDQRPWHQSGQPKTHLWNNPAHMF